MRHGTCHRRRLRSGIVLILVLIIVMMVSLAGFSFVATMYNEEQATRLRGEEIQAHQLARSGVVLISTLVEQPPDALHNAGGIHDNPDLFRGVLAFENESTKQRGRFSIVSPRLEDGEPSGFRFGLENESAKLHLGALLQWDKKEAGTAQRALTKLPGMTHSMADAILDWVDRDGAPRTFGAESEFYQALDHPYAPRNAPVECLEEMLLIRGVSRELLFGWDINRNHLLDPEEAARAEAAKATPSFAVEEPSVPWSSLLTVHSAERNIDPTGAPRINLNHADLDQLHQQLRQAFGEPLANFVIAYRQHGPYQGNLEANTPPDSLLDLSIRPRGKITSALELVNARVRIRATDARPIPVLASPLSDQRSDFADGVLEFLDYVTVDPQPILRGRVNVNLAPPQVLAAVPHMEEAMVRQILVERESSTRHLDPRRRHPVWLLLEGVVELPRMKDLNPYLTCGGEVYRAQIIGHFDEFGPTARAEVVLDATQQPARQLYWKDLRILGRGYPREVLESDVAGEFGTPRGFSRL